MYIIKAIAMIDMILFAEIFKLANITSPFQNNSLVTIGQPEKYA